MAQARIPLKEQVPPKDRVAASLKRLATSSEDLTSVTSGVAEIIGSIEKSLGIVKPPVAAWHTMTEKKWDGISHWHRDIGYARIGNAWCVALRNVNGFDGEPDEVETWPFAEAPPWMQLEALGKLPDLVEELVKRTEDTAAKLRAKLPEAQEVSAAIAAFADEQIQVEF